MSTQTVHLLIHGRVQGVGYRAWMVSRARALGVNGWVRNRRNGQVEAVVSGDAAPLETLLTECRQGPPAARVTEIVVQDWEGEVGSGFRSAETV